MQNYKTYFSFRLPQEGERLFRCCILQVSLNSLGSELSLLKNAVNCTSCAARPSLRMCSQGGAWLAALTAPYFRV
jgi:hypothetical protein